MIKVQRNTGFNIFSIFLYTFCIYGFVTRIKFQTLALVFRYKSIDYNIDHSYYTKYIFAVTKAIKISYTKDINASTNFVHAIGYVRK